MFEQVERTFVERNAGSSLSFLLSPFIGPLAAPAGNLIGGLLDRSEHRAKRVEMLKRQKQQSLVNIFSDVAGNNKPNEFLKNQRLSRVV